MLTMKNSAVFLSEFPSRVCIAFVDFMSVISGLKGNFSSDRIFGVSCEEPAGKKSLGCPPEPATSGGRAPEEDGSR